jgi:hypothetical protein
MLEWVAISRAHVACRNTVATGSTRRFLKKEFQWKPQKTRRALLTASFAGQADYDAVTRAQLIRANGDHVGSGQQSGLSENSGIDQGDTGTRHA